MPTFVSWFAAFGLSAIAAVLVTYVLLAIAFRAKLRQELEPPPVAALSPRTRTSAIALAASACGMVAAAAAGWDVGVITLLEALGVAVVVVLSDRDAYVAIARRMPWQILPLVAGLFVVVDALDRSGALAAARSAIAYAHGLPPLLGALVTTLATAVAACVANNLPIALAAAFAWAGTPADRIFHAAVLGIDLGPNL